MSNSYPKWGNPPPKGKITVAKSVDGGITWTEETTMNDSSERRNPYQDLGQDDLHCAWNEGYDAHQQAMQALAQLRQTVQQSEENRAELAKSVDPLIAERNQLRRKLEEFEGVPVICDLEKQLSDEKARADRLQAELNEWRGPTSPSDFIDELSLKIEDRDADIKRLQAEVELSLKKQEETEHYWKENHALRTRVKTLEEALRECSRVIQGLTDEIALCRGAKSQEPLMIAVSEADTARKQANAVLAAEGGFDA